MHALSNAHSFFVQKFYAESNQEGKNEATNILTCGLSCKSTVNLKG